MWCFVTSVGPRPAWSVEVYAHTLRHWEKSEEKSQLIILNWVSHLKVPVTSLVAFVSFFIQGKLAESNALFFSWAAVIHSGMLLNSGRGKCPLRYRIHAIVESLRRSKGPSELASKGKCRIQMFGRTRVSALGMTAGWWGPLVKSWWPV